MLGRGRTLGPTAGLALLLALAPHPALAAGHVEGSPDWVGGFCVRLEGMIDAEQARVRKLFARSLVDVAQAVRAERRLEGPPELTSDEAVTVARRLWAMWLPIAPAASVNIDGEQGGAWLLLPKPAPDPPYTGDPIRIDKETGEVTWTLPDPSEHERMRAELCGPPAQDPTGLSAAGE